MAMRSRSTQMPLLVVLSGKRKICYIGIFPLMRILIVHRNRFFCLIVPRSAAESLIHDAVQGLHSIARLSALEAAKKDAYLFIIIALYDNEETIVKTLGYLTSAMDDGIIPP